MRPSHILYGVALLFILGAIIALTRSGELKGVRLVFAWISFGCFALGWIGDTFGW